AHQAVRVHTNQHRFAATFSIASNQRDMRLASIHFAFVSNYAEFTMAGAHQRLAHAVHITLVLHAITDQLSHRQNFQSVSTAKIDQVGNTCHAPVVAHDLADDSCWNKPCEASQVHRRLRLPSTHQDAALTCSQGKHVSRPRQIGGPRGGIDCHLDCSGTVVRRNTSGHTISRINSFTKGCAV